MLTKNQRLTVFMMLSGFSNNEIAAQIGVHPRTLRRWMKDPDFCRTLKLETRHAWETARAQAQSAARRLMDNANAAARGMQTILLSDRTEAKVYTRAADVSFRAAARWLEVLAQTERVPMLKVEMPSDIDADAAGFGETKSPPQLSLVSDDEEEPEEDVAGLPLPCDSLRDEEAAMLSAVSRKLDGNPYPVNDPAEERDPGDDAQPAPKAKHA
jgi:hypothetical protein